MPPLIVLYLRSDVAWERLNEDNYLDQEKYSTAVIPISPQRKRELLEQIRCWNRCFSLSYFNYRQGLKDIADWGRSRISHLDLVLKNRHHLDILRRLDDAVVIPVDDDDWFAPQLAEVVQGACGAETDLISWNDAVYCPTRVDDSPAGRTCVFPRPLQSEVFWTNAYGITSHGLKRCPPEYQAQVLDRHSTTLRTFRQHAAPMGHRHLRQSLAVTLKSPASFSKFKQLSSPEQLLACVPRLLQRCDSIPPVVAWAEPLVRQTEDLNRRLANSARLSAPPRAAAGERRSLVSQASSWLTPPLNRTNVVESRADGSTNTVYCNYVNDPILSQLAHGPSNNSTDKWITAVQFNNRGDPLQYAHPSAVVSFDESKNDLGIVYRPTAGLIEKMAYYGAAAPGYLKTHALQQGANGAPVLQKELSYTSVTAGGMTIYPLTRERKFRDDAGTQPLDTDYAYQFFAGTTAVQQRTTTWPIVPGSQNGSGLAESRIEKFDQWGNQVSLIDERGVVADFTVDVVTGGQLLRIGDATGMALATDFTLDNLGRTTQSLGPAHTIDLNGVATVVRTANWWIYQDAINQIWTAQGYATGTAPNYSYTLVNPVSITITDGAGNPTDHIQATRATTSGPLLPTDTFPQSSYVRWTHNLFNDGGQQTAARIYFAIPPSGDGLKGVNYNEITFGYDSLARQNLVVNGGGTITRTVRDPRDLALSIWGAANGDRSN